MKRKLITSILLLTLCLLLLSGCIEIDIDAGIGFDFTAYLAYGIEIDVSEVDPQYHEIIANALNRFGWLYQEERGFTVGVNIDEDIYTLNMSKRVPNNSFAEAFESLERLLTDENITPFMQVDMDLESFPRQEQYIISAMLDISQIIRLSSKDELPSDVMHMLDDGLAEGNGAISLSIPVSEIIKSSHELDEQHLYVTMEVPIDLDGQTEFELSGVVVYLEDGRQSGSIVEIIDNLYSQRNTALIVCAAAGFILLLVIVSLIARRRKKTVL